MSARKSFAHRKICSLPDNPNRVSKNKFSGCCKKREDVIKLVKYIDDNLIGKNATFIGPYGRRKVVNCDYAASGRSLQFIEDYILREVLPNCGSASNTTNITSLQSVLFRHEAKEIFRICVNSTEDDSVIFSGPGCKGPINNFLQEFKWNKPEPPVVFVGPCEARSMILSWKDVGAKVVRISESKEGFLDLNDLENQLIAHQNYGGQLIGCFSAANEITGILADDVATTLLLHQHGALAFWDYTTAAPYVQLDMNPTLPGVEESAVQKDVMFFSGHKFIGGLQTPGVLIAKKILFRDSASSAVDSLIVGENERQVIDLDLQEDQSTASVVEEVRAGLVMHLKEAVGVPAIMTREEKITRTVLAHAKNIPEFVLLGNSSHSLKRLPFFSFIVRHPRGMFLHYNFVCSVLNDVFGIQARGSGADFGSHSLDFMGIDLKLAEEYEKILSSICGNDSSKNNDHRPELEILRPGFTRISLPFCISDAELGFVLEALKMVATEGWKLLPQYTLKSTTGEWIHHSNSIFRDRKWLGSLKYVDGKLIVPERKISVQGTCPTDYEECLHVARCIFNKARKIAQRYPLAAQKFTFETDVEPLRWFMLPNEAHNLLIGNSQNVRHKIPFDPNSYKGCKGDPLEVNACLGGGNKVKNYSLIYKSVEGKEVSSVPKEVTTENKILSSVSQENPSYIERKMASLYHYDSSERQNSFSSEISNPDYSEPICHHTACYSTSPQHAASSHSPAMNPLDVFCFSPQPSLPSPSANNLNTYPSQFHNYQNNCLPSKNYLNQYGNSGNLENLLHVDQACRGVKRFTNFNVTDRAQYNGKLDPQHPVNKVHFLLGRNETSRQRCNSLGSSLVLHPRNRNNLGCSCRSLTDGETSLNLSECSFSSNEDIHAYVTEVTKELATEIKSEIREVISKVEDVLSESIDAEGSINNLSEPRASICFEPKCEKLERTNSLPSASANDIAQYLMGVSKEMAEEMKSEIRGLVSSVVSTDSSPTLNNKEKKVTIEPQSKDRKDKHKKNEVSTVNNENISQSRDSGINLSYTETIVDSKVEKKKKLFQGKVDAEKNEESAVSKRNRSESLDSFPEDERTPGCRSESLDSLQENEDSDAAAKNQVSRRKISRASKKAEKCLLKNRLSGESSNDEGTNTEENVKSRWCCPSKAVWKPTVEAIKEFEMIQNNDKILICLSGGKNSLAILHTLQQYRCYASSKGIHFDLGVITFHPNCSNLNAKALILYLEGLRIPYYFEEQVEGDGELLEVSNSICNVCWKIKRGRLYAMAKKRNYNVIALGHNFDDAAETFLLSAFHNGRLRSIKAHYYIPDKDIRVIRPFVYVREKALKQFSENKCLPAVPESCHSCKTMSKEKQRSKQLLLHQESVFPRLFSSLKTALHPLISYRFAGEEGRIGKYVTDSDETSLT